MISSFIILGLVISGVFLLPRLTGNLDAAAAEKENPGYFRLLLVSLTGLYVELLLIRWLGTEVRVFAYVQNLILTACFLGFGIGCFQSGRPANLLAGLAAVAALAAIVAIPVASWQDLLLHVSNLLTLSSDAALWGVEASYSESVFLLLCIFAAALTAVMLWLIIQSMIPFGRWIGNYFDHADNIVRAYAVNLTGSLLGTWLLAALSLFWLPPALWIVLAFGLVFAVIPRTRRNGIAGIIMLAATLLAVWQVSGHHAIWSPYQKLSVSKLNEEGEHFVKVNNVGYMSMTNTMPEFQARHPELAAGYKDSTYDSPFRFVKHGAKVLIVGAGAGNDASAALRNGAAHVDAVEIDPVIYDLGKRLHPDKPYQSDKVNVIINDARNFLRESSDKYDAVIFGLLDSHTEFSGYTNMRVDNYVYTKEAFAQARRLLAPGGVLILKFEVRQPWTWIGHRFYGMLTEIFGHAPVTYRVPWVGSMASGTVFIESDDESLWAHAAEPDMQAFLTGHPPEFPLEKAAAPAPAIDDWPYAYHRSRSIPRTYISISAILLTMAFCLVGRVFTPRERGTWEMFFLGAGFLLMETQLISRLTLYFGTTWIVNSIAISTILIVLVLASLYVGKRKPESCRLYYPALVAALLVNYFFPWERLPFSSLGIGIMLSAAYAVSVFFAGMIFTTTFRNSAKKSGALGANIVGAVAGGLSQNLSFIIGLKALLPVAAACYCAAAFAGRRH